MLTEAQIQATIDHEHLVTRNLQVTQGYYVLSQGMRKFMGSKNVSWCGFATHASKTAGQALRHELMPPAMKSRLIRMAGYDNTSIYLNGVLGKQEETLSEEEDNLLAEALKRVSLLISEGNITVYAELAWPFASLINSFSRDWDYDAGKLKAFLEAHLRPGPIEADGQDHLFEAFTAYYHARFETNAKRKAEWVLQGNLLVGLHEQTRLQPHIETALATPVDLFIEGQREGERGGLGRLIRKKTADMSREFVTRLTTRMLMSITLPSRELKLGQNVVAPTGVMSFPENLYPLAGERVQELVRQFEFGSDTLSGSAANNWASLKDRMGFVVDFFRSHQQYKRMFEPPFPDFKIPDTI